MNLAILGQILACSSALGIAVSYILMKRGIEKAEAESGKFICQPIWWSGQLVLLLAQVLDVIALGLTD
jgi:hypothetical protein